MKRTTAESRLYLMFILMGMLLAMAGGGGLWLTEAGWWVQMPAGILLFIGVILAVAGFLVRFGWGGGRIERIYPWPDGDPSTNDHSSSR
ncbi:MAG: hypothetical protein JXQ27_18135 [Acidobacteria bacterium]|nr:hypothetical protein [Acidobacteriota bacterium]